MQCEPVVYPSQSFYSHVVFLLDRQKLPYMMCGNVEPGFWALILLLKQSEHKDFKNMNIFLCTGKN